MLISKYKGYSLELSELNFLTDFKKNNLCQIESNDTCLLLEGSVENRETGIVVVKGIELN